MGRKQVELVQRGAFAVYPLVLLLAIGAAAADSLDWADDLDEALSRAQAEGKLVLLVLESELCPWCVKLTEETLTAEAVTTHRERFVAVKVSVADQPELGTRYARRGVPQSVFLTGEGRQVGKVEGFVPATIFAARMRDAWAARDLPAEIANFEATRESRPLDAQELARLGRLYVATGQEQKAEPVLEQALEQASQLDNATAAGARLDLLIARLPAQDGELAPELVNWLETNAQHARVVEAQYYAGYALALKGEGQTALALWAKVIAATPESTCGVLAAYYTQFVREAMQRRSNGG
ncbi:MAG: thioredoxin family protein [Armatimonadetes bacterium]|nr:thioredoxin family protein [Armatimonadota bacterium]